MDRQRGDFRIAATAHACGAPQKLSLLSFIEIELFYFVVKSNSFGGLEVDRKSEKKFHH
jgi:hypothetical protein